MNNELFYDAEILREYLRTLKIILDNNFCDEAACIEMVKDIRRDAIPRILRILEVRYGKNKDN